MPIDLGIICHECNNCGAKIHPPSRVSRKAESKSKERFDFPTAVTKLSNEELLPKEVYDEIQLGKHDNDPNLARFKGKTYDECIAIRKTEYTQWRNSFVAEIRTKASNRETELKGKCKNVVKTETEDAIEIEFERHKATPEGTEREGRLLCPNCGKELVRWKTPTASATPITPTPKPSPRPVPKYTLGLRQDPPDKRDYEASRILTVKDEELPKSISYREEMTPVRNQKSLGSCAAFAVTAVREWEEQLKPQRMPIEVLSPLFLYQKTKEIDIWPDEQATSLRFVLKALRKWGCGMEKYYPYRDDWPIQTEIPWHVYGRARWEKIGSYHRLRTKQEMRRWLVEHGPFVLGVPVGREMFDPKPPDYEVPPPSDVVGGHAICIVGYDEQGRFIFKNSWSSSWGSDGYAKLSADYLDKIDWFDGWGFLAEK